MFTSFDMNDILFRVLSASEELKTAISGEIYSGDRPDNSEKEDITIDTITVSNDMPQKGTSNINIHMPDKYKNFKGQEQREINEDRLKYLTDIIISILETARVEGLSFWVANQTVLKEPEINQHYTKLRIEWNISKTNNN